MMETQVVARDPVGERSSHHWVNNHKWLFGEG